MIKDVFGVDRKVVACNYSAGTSAIARGARCYVRMIPGTADRAWVLARSRGGRWIQTWVALSNLRDCRQKTIPPEHGLYADDRISCSEPVQILERLRKIASWAGFAALVKSDETSSGDVIE